MIGKPDDKVVSWLDAFVAFQHPHTSFVLELCGNKDGEDTHSGKFSVVYSGKTMFLLNSFLQLLLCAPLCTSSILIELLSSR